MTWAGLPMSTNWKDTSHNSGGIRDLRWKSTSYDSILVVVDRLTKMVHSEPAQMINAPGLAKVFIDLVVRRHGLSDSIIDN